MSPWIEKINHAVEAVNFIYDRYDDEINRLKKKHNQTGADFLVEKCRSEVRAFLDAHNYDAGEVEAIRRGVSSCRGWGQPKRWGYVL